MLTFKERVLTLVDEFARVTAAKGDELPAELEKIANEVGE